MALSFTQSTTSIEFMGDTVQFTLTFDDEVDFWEIMRDVADAHISHKVLKMDVTDLLTEALEHIPTVERGIILRA